jgi:hypothetical protein
MDGSPDEHAGHDAHAPGAPHGGAGHVTH